MTIERDIARDSLRKKKNGGLKTEKSNVRKRNDVGVKTWESMGKYSV